MVYLPIAELSLFITCTITSVDDGLLRTNTGSAGPSSSLTMYVDWLKDTVATTWQTTQNNWKRK